MPLRDSQHTATVNAARALVDGGRADFQDDQTRRALRQYSGVYAIWHTDGTLLYVGASANLGDRLGAHRAGRRSGDEFCVRIFDRMILPELDQRQVTAASRGELSLDALVGTWVRTHCMWSVSLTRTREQAFAIEAKLRGGHGILPAPMLNPNSQTPAGDYAPYRGELSRAEEQGLVFQTGEPVSFTALRHTERAPDMGERFQQHIEPAGTYLNLADPTSDPLPGWVRLEIEFRNPLVVPWNPASGGYDDTSWKAALSNHFGLTGLDLSMHLSRLGHDGIVTVDQHGLVSEIVDLRSIRIDAPRTVRM